MNGVGDAVKRRAIFDYYRVNADILCLQETHCTNEIEHLWTAEWGGCTFYANGTASSRGVAIFINRKYFVNVINHYADVSGRYQILDVEINDVELSLINLYAPNEDKPGFFYGLSDKIKASAVHKILLGDYNLVLDTNLDRKNSSYNNNNACSAVKNIMQEYDLIDVYREFYPTTKRYSWFRGTNSASRIDFALISETLKSRTANVTYFQGILTDHSAMQMSFDLFQHERGCGYWKFNNSLLKRKDFCENMGSFLSDKLANMDEENVLRKWDLLKSEIKEFCIKFSKECASEKKLVLAQLSETVSELQDKIDLLSPEEVDILEKTKIDLNELVLDRARGLIFRSKAQWLCEAECNTKYFYNLERSRSEMKTCYKLIDEEGVEISDPEKILNMQEAFYRKLYKKDKSVCFKCAITPEITVNDNHLAKSEDTFSDAEIAEAVLQLNNDKTPGPDGIPIDYYKMFWGQLKHIVKEVIHEVFQTGQMITSSQQGVINLIPKKGKDIRQLKNLRPITLLNSDYKIIEKAIANRMVPALSDIIHTDQAGFLPDRRISTNIRRIFDLLKHAEKDRIEAVLLSLDFQKAFDQISTDSVLGCLKLYGFSNYIQEWTKILYSGFQAKVQNNGNFSSLFPVERSVHQGAPNSCYYFILVAELLANALRNNEKIHGISIKEIEYFLTQYADDMDTALPAESEVINEVFQTLEWFRSISGLSVNYDKTTLYRIGSLKKSKAELYTTKNVNWTEHGINVLGVDVRSDDKEALECNYNPILHKIDNIFAMWSRRNITLTGKVNIVNTLVASLFVYKMMVLPNISNSLIARIEQKISNFLWNQKKPKIALKTLQLPKNKGGMGLVDLRKKEISLKATWISAISSDPHLTNIIYSALNIPVKDLIWSCNLRPSDVEKFETNNIFWRDVLKAWSEVNFSPNLQYWHPLWFNSCIRIAGNVIFWKEQYENGLIEISQLYDGKQFIMEKEANEKYKLSVLKFNSLKSAIRKENNRFPIASVSRQEPRVSVLAYESNISRILYRELCDKMPVSLRPKHRWEKKLHSEIDDEVWFGYFKNIYRITQVGKYRSFQYRLLMCATITNIDLKRWGISVTDLCSLCGKCKETLEHLFFDCEISTNLRQKLCEWLLEEFGRDKMTISKQNIILGNVANVFKFRIIDFFFLMYKQYIYRQRCLKENLSFRHMRQLMLQVKNSEKYYAIKNNCLNKFHKKWDPLMKLTNNANDFDINEFVREYIENV